MNKVAVGVAMCGVVGMSVLGLRSVFAVSQGQQLPLTGTVQQVWEDGFRLETGDRTLTVDTWDICGDSTGQSLQPGEQVTLSGEMDGGEFDAFAVTKADGTNLCAAANDSALAIPDQPQGEAREIGGQTPGTVFTGTVRRVWEDGFRLETGDRTLTVDTWALCGDNTRQFVAPDDTVTVTGEFAGNEFDAFSLADVEANQMCL